MRERETVASTAAINAVMPNALRRKPNTANSRSRQRQPALFTAQATAIDSGSTM